MTLVAIAAALVRTTLATSLAALVAWGLLTLLRVGSPRAHRVACLLVLAQGWLLFPFTIEVETTAPSTPRRAAGLVPAVIQELEAGPIAFENETQWGWGHFETIDSLLIKPPQSQPVPDPFPLAAITAWLLGALAIVLLAARRYLQVLRTLPLGTPPDDSAWQAEWHAARSSAQLRRRQCVDLRVTAALGPLLHWAPWSYLILVPRTLWSTLAAPQRQAILRHELAHVRRRDLWKSLAIRLLALPQWFNPCAWLAVRRFDEAAEWACDDAAARHADDRLAFAASLLESAEYALAPYPASAPAAHGTLTRRIHRLVSPRFKEESKMKLLLVPMLLFLAAVAQTIRIERVVAEEPPAVAAEPVAPKSDRQIGPPLSPEQMEFDRLAKEYEHFARMDYVIEPPDILSIEGVKLVPKAPHHLETFDLLRIHAKGALPEHPIDNSYNVDADGAVDLGPAYGRIEVIGKTIEEARDAVRAQLAKVLTDANVSVSLLASSNAQAITGQHLVAMDGRVKLGNYGSVYVTGMTRKEARAAIELKLAEQLDAPEVSVDVLAYNSKVYYVITKTAEGDDVTRAPIPFPADRNETVGAAITRMYGDPEDLANPRGLVANATISLHRVDPKIPNASRVYAIEWDPALKAPAPLTNHSLLPGDRLFIRSRESVERRAARRAPQKPAQPRYDDCYAAENVVPTILPRPILPGQAATPVEATAADDSASIAPDSVTLTLAVIEDANDSLAEFRTGKLKADLIVGDGKAFGAAIRVLEKNSLIKIADRERIDCSLGGGDRHDAELPLPNPTTRLKPTQTEPTQVIVRRLGKDSYAVKLEFRQMVDGNENYQSIELAMGLGEVDVLECPNAAGDSASGGKAYLLIQLAAAGDKSVAVEPSPAAPPRSESLVEGQPTRQFMLEPRFVPTLRNPKKPKPPTEKSTYLLQPYDTIKLRVERPHRPAYVLNWGDVQGEFTLARDGSIRFGGNLESLHLADMTSAEACRAIEKQLQIVAPECKATLELGPLASEKFFVSVQHPDGTEIAVGALPVPVDASAQASLELSSLRRWVGDAFEAADWELAEPSDSPDRKASLPGPGDRLVVKVRAGAELGRLEYPQSRPGFRVTLPAPEWLEVFGKKTRRSASEEPYLIL